MRNSAYFIGMQITGAGYVVADNFGFSGHAHEREAEFHLFTKVDGTFYNGTQPIHVSDLSLVFSGPKTVHHAQHARGTSMRFYFVRFIPDTSTSRLIDKLGTVLPSVCARAVGVAQKEMFESIRRKTGTQQPYSQQSAWFLLQSLLYEIAAESQASHSDRHPAVDRCIALMQDSIFGSLSLEQCSRSAGVGASYLIRLFHHTTGLSPLRYYNHLKMDTARHLLRTTDEPIYVIAQRLGFWDEFHFSKAFKRIAGVSPRNFRNS